MQNSLERIYPDTLDENDTLGLGALRLHLQRYQFAAENLKPGLIADAACGAGYGSHFLASNDAGTIEKIIAIDIDAGAIAYAKKRYQHPLIQFLEQDILNFENPVPFDTVISLETIEHLAAPQQFVEKMAKQLNPGGRFIASAPVTPSVDANPFHFHDFTEDSFRNLFLHAGLTEINSLLQVQAYQPFTLMVSKKGRRNDVRKSLFAYYLRNPRSLWRRLQSMVRDGFTNKYLVVAFEKPGRI
jgi:SAM-dependent methyltransferase